MSTTPQTSAGTLPGHRTPPPPPAAPVKPVPVGTPLVSALNYLRKKSLAAAYDPEDKTIIRTSHLDTLLDAYDKRVEELNAAHVINLNQPARVVLTDIGRRIWAAGPYVHGLLGDDGALEVPLYELMEVFGPYLPMGSPMPFTTANIHFGPLPSIPSRPVQEQVTARTVACAASLKASLAEFTDKAFECEDCRRNAELIKTPDPLYNASPNEEAGWIGYYSVRCVECNIPVPGQRWFQVTLAGANEPQDTRIPDPVTLEEHRAAMENAVATWNK